MKRLWIGLVMVLSACAATPQTPPETPSPAPAHHRLGADFAPVVTWLTNLPAVTGNTATITLWDSTLSLMPSTVERVMFEGFYDQAVTVLYRTKNTGSTTWRTMNGNGSGDTVTASTATSIDYFMLGPQNQIQVVTGGTGPTTSETSLGLVYERTLGM